MTETRETKPLGTYEVTSNAGETITIGRLIRKAVKRRREMIARADTFRYGSAARRRANAEVDKVNTAINEAGLSRSWFTREENLASRMAGAEKLIELI